MVNYAVLGWGCVLNYTKHSPCETDGAASVISLVCLLETLLLPPTSKQQTPHTNKHAARIYSSQHTFALSLIHWRKCRSKRTSAILSPLATLVAGWKWNRRGGKEETRLRVQQRQYGPGKTLVLCIHKHYSLSICNAHAHTSNKKKKQTHSKCIYCELLTHNHNMENIACGPVWV